MECQWGRINNNRIVIFTIPLKMLFINMTVAQQNNVAQWQSAASLSSVMLYCACSCGDQTLMVFYVISYWNRTLDLEIAYTVYVCVCPLSLFIYIYTVYIPETGESKVSQLLLNIPRFSNQYPSKTTLHGRIIIHLST